MKNKLRKSNKQKNNYQHYELKIKLNRTFTYICSKSKIPFEKYKYFRLASKIIYRSFTNICYFSNRTKSVTKWNFGRNFFRKSFNLGLLNGFRKATW